MGVSVNWFKPLGGVVGREGFLVVVTCRSVVGGGLVCGGRVVVAFCDGAVLVVDGGGFWVGGGGVVVACCGGAVMVVDG